MREALGQPLSEISSTVLNKMVSKEVSMDMRKYKNNATSKRSKSKEAEVIKPKQQYKDNSVDETVYVNNMRKYLRDLDVGTADQVALLKLLVLKCDEADLSYNRLRNVINNG